MSNEREEHAPLLRQKDWETAQPDGTVEVAQRLGATISVRFDADAARLIRQAAKNANQTQADFVREAAIRSARERVGESIVPVPEQALKQQARPNGTRAAPRSVLSDG